MQVYYYIYICTELKSTLNNILRIVFFFDNFLIFLEKILFYFHWYLPLPLKSVIILAKRSSAHAKFLNQMRKLQTNKCNSMTTFLLKYVYASTGKSLNDSKINASIMSDFSFFKNLFGIFNIIKINKSLK